MRNESKKCNHISRCGKSKFVYISKGDVVWELSLLNFNYDLPKENMTTENRGRVITVTSREPERKLMERNIPYTVSNDNPVLRAYIGILELNSVCHGI